MSHLPYDDLPDTTFREIQRRKETPATPAEKKTDSSTSFPGHLAARGM